MKPADQLQHLQIEMRKCRLCLREGHTITPGAIFSGSARANIMIIGQAPGVTEVEAGRPFNASSGTRLFQWLNGAGLDEALFRQNQYMTSVTKCFPGKAKSGGGDRVPSKEERELCWPFLQREIELVNPSIILPVGRLAINLFFSSNQPLTQIIGLEKELNRRYIIPLPHPSGASRWHQNTANQKRIEAAISLLTKRIHQLNIKV